MTKYISRAAIAAAALAFGVSGANATNNIATGTLSVTADVITACIVTGNTLAFGNIATTTTDATHSSTSISVSCPVPFTVAMSTSGSYDSGTNKYYVTDGATPTAHTIGYTLSDAQGGTNWNGGVARSYPGSGTDTTISVYGILDGLSSGQPQGHYTDSVQILVNY